MAVGGTAVAVACALSAGSSAVSDQAIGKERDMFVPPIMMVSTIGPPMAMRMVNRTMI